MPNPEPIGPGADSCGLSSRWVVRQDVMDRVVRVATRFRLETGRSLTIISGYRTPAKQRELARQGRPAAPVDVSNHTSCPATAVDVRIGMAPSNALKATLGRIAIEEGLRWGGGSPVNPSTGIPSDWNHFDVGPRRRA